MTASIINNHGDVVLFIHETLAKKKTSIRPLSSRAIISRIWRKRGRNIKASETVSQKKSIVGHANTSHRKRHNIAYKGKKR